MKRFRIDSIALLARLALFSLIPAVWVTTAVPVEADEACLACHGEEDATTAQGTRIHVDGAALEASVHGALGCTGCHAAISDYPHPDPVPRADCAQCHEDATSKVGRSVHGMLGAEACASCHGDAHRISPPGTTPGAECAACHEQILETFETSIHATIRANGGQDAPACRSCHGATHEVVSGTDPISPVTKENLPNTCGSCHANPEFLARHKIPFARPVEAYRLSIHGREIESGNHDAASCSSCHTSHAIRPGWDPQSSINHFHVAETCGGCHGAINKTYLASVHGRAVLAGSMDSPACTGCHGEHAILAPTEPGSLVNPARVSSVTCGHCHADTRLASRFNLSLDKVPSFRDSFHGLAGRAGSQTVANCASCHGVHNILPSSDPASRVHPANLAATCGVCHPGAGERFRLSPVHVVASSPEAHPVVAWIRWVYLVLIPLTVAFMASHNVLDYVAKALRNAPRHDSGEQAERMNRQFRISHWLVVISFPVLAVTGFALTYPESWWAVPLLRWEEQIMLRGWVHRIAAVVLLAGLAHHLAHLLLRRRDRVIIPNLAPSWQDLRDLWGIIGHNVGWQRKRPTFGMFSYAEKIEYWAFLWGIAVMAISGFILWFNNFSLRYFPKWVSDAATAIHFYEAILATLSILIWHLYMTVFDPEVYPMDRAWITGKTSADHLRHTRPAYYEALAERLRERQGAPSDPRGAD